MVSDGGRTTVLVVDDEEDLVDVYADWLPGYDTRTATGGREALRRVSHEVDIVLLDRRMPGPSGDEVLDRIREAGHDCRVVMVTAVSPDFDVVDMPFDAYLTKPVDRQELGETVEQVDLLADYSECNREAFRTAEKIGALRAQKPPGELSESDEFRTLEERFERLRRERDDAARAMDRETLTAALADLSRAETD